MEFTRQTNFKITKQIQFVMKLNFILKTSKNSIIIFKWLLYFLQVCKSVPGANLISSPAWGGVITDSVKTQTYKKSNQSKVFISIVRLTKNIKTYKDPSFINEFDIQTEWDSGHFLMFVSGGMCCCLSFVAIIGIKKSV